MMHNKKILLLPALALGLCSCASSGTAVKADVAADTVKAQRFDNGKMWTFDIPPVKYFEDAYKFHPTEAWLKHVRLSALKFADWCSSSFVSSDGLIMTNHHCVDEIIPKIEKTGENLRRDGFYAKSIEDERRVPDLFVEQLVGIRDVTSEVETATNMGKNDQEKTSFRRKKIEEIEKAETKSSGLKAQVVTLYNGGKYSLYTYKKYTDVRAVFIVESNIGFFGGDPDNFTYPRYNLDCSFLRVYDSTGHPLKTNDYFKWSKDGAHQGEPVFVVGNPGRTERLMTAGELESTRDLTFKPMSYLLSNLRDIYYDAMFQDSANSYKWRSAFFYAGNSAKVYQGSLEGLKDQYLMARKRAFDREFKARVDANADLKAKYGHLWGTVENVLQEVSRTRPYVNGFSINKRYSSAYLSLAKDIVKYAEQMKLPEEKRDAQYRGSRLDSIKSQMFPKEFNASVEGRKLELSLGYMQFCLGADNDAVKEVLGGDSPKEAAKKMLASSMLKDSASVASLLSRGHEAILSCKDPLIDLAVKSEEIIGEKKPLYDEARASLSVLDKELGRALYDVYGPQIPPDATFTLRISDGLVKDYEYNGTKAPVKTTFYGIYDRNSSSDGRYPWDLPKKWLDHRKDLDLSTPFDFISTCDIIGGNSGSPVINKEAEIVGLAFDGNMESLPGSFIYMTEKNRTISVASSGIIEAVGKVYEAARLKEELESGKIPDRFKPIIKAAK